MAPHPLARSLAVALVALLPCNAAASSGDGQAHLPLSRYHDLLSAERGGGDGRVDWKRGEVTLTLPDDAGESLVVNVRTVLRVHEGEGRALVPMLPAEVALDRAVLDGSELGFRPRRGRLVASISGTGTRRLELRYRVTDHALDGGRRAANVPLPPMPGASLAIQNARGSVDVWPALNTRRSGRTVEGSLPATRNLSLQWGATASEAGLRRIALRLEPGEQEASMRLDATLAVRLDGDRGTVPLAPRNGALVDVTENAEPLPVETGPQGYRARLEGAGRHLVDVEARLPIDRSEGRPRVTLGLPRSPITHVELRLPGAREVAVRPEAPVRTSVEERSSGTRTIARADLPPSDELTVAWSKSRAAPEEAARVNAVAHQILRLEEGAIRTTSHLRYDVIRGRVAHLDAALPADAVVYEVTGDWVEDWRTLPADEDQPRRLRLDPAGPLEGDEATARVALERTIPDERGETLDLPILRPLGAHRIRGVLALVDGDEIAFGTAEAEGYSAVGTEALPKELRDELADRVGQAYKHVGEPGPLRAPIEEAGPEEVRLDARVETLYRVEESALSAEASILIEIDRGRDDEVLLTLPEGARVADVTAPSLHRAEPAPDAEVPEGRKAHRVRFTQRLEGAVRIEVKLEQLLPEELGELELPALRVADAKVEEGAFGITAAAGIEVEPTQVEGARSVDVDELPRAVRLRSERDLRHGYTYTRAPWSLRADVRRRETVETLQAVVTSARVQTTALSDGHVVTRAALTVDNGERPSLRIRLPGETPPDVWAVRAGGEKVKAVAGESGGLEVPLPRNAESRVALVYGRRGDPLGTVGRLDVEAFGVNALLTDLIWTLRVPETLRPLSIGSELERLDDGGGSVGMRSVRSATQDLDVPIELPRADRLQRFRFGGSVRDPDQEPPAVAVRYVTGAGPGVGMLVWIVALALLLPAAWRRARRQRLGPARAVGTGLALALVLVRAVAWGFAPAEAVLFIAVLAGTALLSRWRARFVEVPV